MTVAEVLVGLSPRLSEGIAAREVRGLALDSRRVQAGDLFFALPGQHADGSRFSAEALSRGALAVVGERAAGPETIVVPHVRRALALAAARFYDHPDRHLKLIGVTGTNGKTTTALLVSSVVEAAGEKVGLLGTLGVRVGGQQRSTGFTTPEAPELCALLDEMVRAGVQHCAMEVSSHALAQERVTGLAFAAAGFTHLTRDHLDFHGDFEAYFQAKRRLFTELLEPSAISVVNGDDPFGKRLYDELVQPAPDGRRRLVWRFGRSAGLEIRITAETLALEGTRLKLETPRGALELSSQLIGAHNAENLALAAGLSLAAGFSRDAVERGLNALQAVPGRLERVEVPGRPVGFVDYAHTDDALARVLGALRELAGTKRRLLVVFGCGGDRDPGKRPLMGKAAARGADVVIATSDNPRSEEPRAILEQVRPGLVAGGRHERTVDALRGGEQGFLVEEDRSAAIALAARIAGPQDVILVAGKGHETVQVRGAERLELDDRVELRRALEARV